jgi:hypothetical protein
MIVNGLNHSYLIVYVFINNNAVKNVKQSRYTPWRRLGGEKV